MGQAHSGRGKPIQAVESLLPLWPSLVFQHWGRLFFAQNHSKYMKENYDVYQIRMPKGRKDEIKAHAEAHSESVNGFINRAIPRPWKGTALTSPKCQSWPGAWRTEPRQRKRWDGVTARTSMHSGGRRL